MESDTNAGICYLNYSLWHAPNEISRILLRDNLLFLYPHNEAYCQEELQTTALKHPQKTSTSWKDQQAQCGYIL